MGDGSEPLIGGQGGNGDTAAQGGNGATDHPLATGSGRGRPAGMAILDPELHLALQEVDRSGRPARGSAVRRAPLATSWPRSAGTRSGA